MKKIVRRIKKENIKKVSSKKLLVAINTIEMYLKRVVDLKVIFNKNSILVPYKWKKSYIVGIIKRELKDIRVEYLSRLIVERLKVVVVKDGVEINSTMNKIDLIKLVTAKEALFELGKEQ